MQQETIIYKTKHPLSFYFWIITSVWFVTNAIIKADNFLGPFVYSLMYIIGIYWYLSNYSGKIKLTKEKIVVDYSLFKFLNKEIYLKEIQEFDYKTGFYNMSSDRGNTGNNYVPKICYDTLILLKRGNTKDEIRINTRIFQFEKFINELRKIKTIKEKASW